MVHTAMEERHNVRIKTSKNGGFTLVEIMIVVLIIGLLATMVSQNLVGSRNKARQTVCISNLQNIEGAIQAFALEFNKAEGQAVAYNDISGYLKNAVVCPAGGSSFEDSYSITTVDAAPTCLKVQSGRYAHVLPQRGT